MGFANMPSNGEPDHTCFQKGVVGGEEAQRASSHEGNEVEHSPNDLVEAFVYVEAAASESLFGGSSKFGINRGAVPCV